MSSDQQTIQYTSIVQYQKTTSHHVNKKIHARTQCLQTSHKPWKMLMVIGETETETETQTQTEHLIRTIKWTRFELLLINQSL